MIQYDDGGTVTTLWVPTGLHRYYSMALNTTQFCFAQRNSASHHQLYLGGTSGSYLVSNLVVGHIRIYFPSAPTGQNWAALEEV